MEYSVNQIPQNVTNVTEANISYPNCLKTLNWGIYIDVSLCILDVLGIAANILSFIVLHKKFTPNPVNFFLKALAIADICVLVTSFVGVVSYKARTLHIYIIFALKDLALLVSVWLIVTLSFSRYVAVAKPLTFHMYSSSKVARRATVVIVILAFVFTSIKSGILVQCSKIYTHNSEKNTTTWALKCTPDYSSTHSKYILASFYGGLLFLLPVIPLLFFSYGQVVKLIKSQKQLSHSQTEEVNASRLAQSHQLTKVVLAVVLVFFLTYSSLFIWSLSYIVPSFYNHFSQPEHICKSILFDHIIYINFHINSSVNFIIYVFFNKEFRNKTKEMLCCKQSHHDNCKDSKTTSTSKSQTCYTFTE